MSAVFPGAQNVFVPNHEATGKLVVDYSRNADDFPLNKYVQIIPVTKTSGLYLRMTVEECGRLLSTDGAELVWPDGADAPTGADGTESHEWFNYLCKRYAPTARLGDQTINVADWDILAKHLAIKTQQAMTLRTQIVVTKITTSGNYDAANVLDVTAISGNVGDWTASTTARQTIRRSLNVAANQIMLQTMGLVKPQDLILVISPTLARLIAETQEIVDYIKGSPDAKAQVTGEFGVKGRNAYYGLPNQLYGIELVVEDTVKATNKKGATRATSYVMPATKAVLLSRPGGLIGVADTPNFSTCCVFIMQGEELAVETWKDVNNKRTVARVIDNFGVEVVAPTSGVLLTAVSA